MPKAWVLLLALGSFYAYTLELSGPKVQGTLLRGEVAAGTQVALNGEPVKVSPDGKFVIGFGRDAALENTLTLTGEDGVQQWPVTLSAREYDVQRIEGVEQKYVSPPASVTERIAKDNRQIAKARAVTSDRLDFWQSFIWPAQGRVSGVYGSQRVFNGVPKRPHFGLDVAGPVGTDVVAPADGVVTLFVPDMYYSGGTLIIDHGYGVSSTFIHLSKSLVSAGDEVKQGQKIAEIGKTGRATGPHLDWRINWFGERIDPQLLVPPRQ
ncbi:M23 family metallopeptidase [Bowmanella sp. Y26]|uniref:M23 family metallopeptidase n=1 Tax=Bowmanella yangjiangensis TaxID=2811230 RepID=UPI001BDBF9AB|nr:M23 family metallopeptidase [Bowmanella yangjiangensis]MBT1063464.1 M23 family metallopeptidase [Bowmanella yangjiangensis]